MCSELPPEIWEDVFQNLSVKDQKNVALVSKQFEENVTLLMWREPKFRRNVRMSPTDLFGLRNLQKIHRLSTACLGWNTDFRSLKELKGLPIKVIDLHDLHRGWMEHVGEVVHDITSLRTVTEVVLPYSNFDFRLLKDMKGLPIKKIMLSHRLED